MLPATATFNKVAAASSILSEIENAQQGLFLKMWHVLLFFAEFPRHFSRLIN